MPPACGDPPVLQRATCIRYRFRRERKAFLLWVKLDTTAKIYHFLFLYKQVVLKSVSALCNRNEVKIEVARFLGTKRESMGSEPL